MFEKLCKVFLTVTLAVFTLVAAALLVLCIGGIIAQYNKAHAAEVTIALIDLQTHSIYERGGDGKLIEKCVVTVNDSTYPVQDASCALVGPATYKQLVKDYPAAVVWYTNNGKCYNTI